MTEAEWLSGTDSLPLLRSLEGIASDRKLRLLAAAFCRRIDGRFHSPLHRSALDVVERYADGEATDSELEKINEQCVNSGEIDFYIDLAADFVTRLSRMWPLEGGGKSAAFLAAEHALCMCNAAVSTLAEKDGGIEAGKKTSIALNTVEIALLREHFGNPFRPVAFDSACLTSNVLALAQGIYADRAFDRMPILADALEEAGCSNEDILLHCRQPGEHVRGCWVVDLVLGKK